LRVFLLEYHPYRRETHNFNGNPKRRWRRETMNLENWLKDDEIEKKEILELFNSNGEPMFDDLEFFQRLH
jgi:hypothetical protein